MNMAENELVVGSKVPDFNLPSNKGGEVKFSDYHGRKVALFFVREYE
jgi:peroxiredoxin